MTSSMNITHEEVFHSHHYLRHTSRRLEHLASLRIPVRNMSVLEMGAGSGDHSSYYIDRQCKVTITDARKDTLDYLRKRFPEHDVRELDMENPVRLQGAPFDIIHCYGLLYHLSDPLPALQYSAENCRQILFLETRVSTEQSDDIRSESENHRDIWRAVKGKCCRPSRLWIFSRLKELFPFVYIPITQPNHEEFPVSWSSNMQPTHFPRAIFIASQHQIENDQLSKQLISEQKRHD